jgi:hypothetical protein
MRKMNFDTNQWGVVIQGEIQEKIIKTQQVARNPWRQTKRRNYRIIAQSLREFTTLETLPN